MTAWWADFFDGDYVRLWSQAGVFAHSAAEAEAVAARLALPAGARVLDVPCGFGRIAGPLHARGLDVVGLDVSPQQIALARDRHPGPDYRIGDMRRPPAGPFAAVLNLYSSFGYFDDPADDRAAVAAWHDVLRPGGVLLMELMHRDAVARTYSPRGAGPGRGPLAETGRTDWVTGVRTSSVTDGTVTKTFRVRLYTVTELVALLREVGFRGVTATGDLAGTTAVTPDTRLVLHATRPATG